GAASETRRHRHKRRRLDIGRDTQIHPAHRIVNMVLRNVCHRSSDPTKINVSPVAPAFPRGPLHKTTAIDPGSFDPPTNGHLDLIQRGSKIFDELIVAILRNPDKDPLFNVSERVAMLESLTGQYSNVRVDTFDGLTVDYADKVGASSVLRGIRALS